MRRQQLTSSRPYQWLTRSELGRRLRRLARQAPLFTASLRFLLAGLLELPGVHPYRLRAGGTRVWLRHPVDSWTFHDIYVKRVYALPDAVARTMPGQEARVLDLGANVGLFGLYARQVLPGCRVVGYEPDPGNLEVLRRNVGPDAGADWYAVVDGAAGASSGQATFAFGLGDSSHEADVGALVRKHDVLPEMAEFDLAKIDIEGGEWEILQDRRLATYGPRAIVLEYHPARCPDAEPRRAAQALLHRAGYRTLNGAAPDSTAAQGMLWAWRERDAPPPASPEPAPSDGAAPGDAG